MTPSVHRWGAGATVFLLTFLLLSTTDAGVPQQDVDQVAVDRAIDRGATWLLTHKKSYGAAGNLVLLTLLHAGVSQESLETLIDEAMEKRLTGTYDTSLIAMSLFEIWKVEKDEERKRHIYNRIKECAQWLVDNQSAHGQWRYGEPIPMASEPKSNDVATGTRKKRKGSKKGPGKTKIEDTVVKRYYGLGGDNSNTQYASLGLRACMEAGIRIPQEVITRAIEWLEKSQGGDGAWAYGGSGSVSHTSDRGSMTAGSISALAIFKYLAVMRKAKGKVNFLKDKDIAKGISWLDKNFSVQKNPKCDKHHYYYLYAIERVGLLLNIDRIGRHAWYRDGAKYLIGKQKKDGHWIGSDRPKPTDALRARDTCFAILFLRRVTRPLATDGGERR